jgi:hypothetical protein
MHAGAAARVLCKSQRVDNTLCWLVVHTPRSSLRLAGARSSPGRVEVAYTMLGDGPDAGHNFWLQLKTDLAQF